MSASIKSVEDDIASHLASGVTNVVLRGTSVTSSQAAIWPGPERPSEGDIPSRVIFAMVKNRDRIVKKIRGGSTIGQEHGGVLRLLGRDAIPGVYATIYGLIKECVEFAEDNPPSGYDHLTCLQGPIYQEAGATGTGQELPKVYADFRWEYRETS